MAQIDPYLVYGFEVALDISLPALDEFESVQHMYLHHLLGMEP
jgi:hypothetical protein